MRQHGSKLLNQALRQSCGLLAFGIALIVWFVLALTHTVKTHGPVLVGMLLVAALSILVGVIGIMGTRRARQLGLDRPEDASQ